MKTCSIHSDRTTVKGPKYAVRFRAEQRRRRRFSDNSTASEIDCPTLNDLHCPNAFRQTHSIRVPMDKQQLRESNVYAESSNSSESIRIDMEVVSNENGLILQSSSSDGSIHSEKSLSGQAYLMPNCPIKENTSPLFEYLSKKADHISSMHKEEIDDSSNGSANVSTSQRRVTFKVEDGEKFPYANYKLRDAMVQTDDGAALADAKWPMEFDLYARLYTDLLNSLIADSAILPSKKMEALLRRYTKLFEGKERQTDSPILHPSMTSFERIRQLDLRLTEARRALANSVCFKM
ncbi:Pc21g21700 protein [Trichuris trichiura]|uniref:Pc21g21700 protein n=1 Tax=Trichuris trichiura TaxID=36087 RepID=A0A077Z6D1_TRITR|nr:Pc21g21700 protein [Trichuris trichiura]